MESFAISVSHIQATLNGGLNRKRELEWMLRLELLRLQDRDLSRQRRFRLVKLGLNNGESEVTGRISCWQRYPSTRRSIEAVCRSSGVEPAGVLLDTGVVPSSGVSAPVPKHSRERLELSLI